MSITFLTAKQTHRFLETDPDRFFSSLQPIDLKARGVRSSAAYKKQACESVQDFTDPEIYQLVQNAKKADSILAKWENCLPGITKIPWVFAKCGSEYEGGLPHTRAGIIFTVNGEMTVKNCIHEKIHLFQRVRKDVVDEYIKARGYIRIYNSHPPLRRSNPDVDQFTYMKNGQVCDGVYMSEDPPHISFTEDGPLHPLEEMAYEFTTRIVQ
jgi:hypothetical protein